MTDAIENMSPQAVHEALAAGQAVLIDVREPHEYDQVHIDGALNFPLSQFDPQALPQADGKYLVFQCAHGVRSLRAAEYCRAMGLAADHHMAGGIAAWMGAGLPTK